MENSLRKRDDRRKRKRNEVKHRKEAEEAKKREELKRLKSLKRKEIMEKIEKLKQVTGNDEVGFKVGFLQSMCTSQWTSSVILVCKIFHHMICALCSPVSHCKLTKCKSLYIYDILPLLYAIDGCEYFVSCLKYL